MDNLYHGTTRSNAEIILSSQFIKPSAGDKHWLGDGVYFYKKDYPFPFGKKRIPIITEQQICIKKENCIKSIADFNYKEKISFYNNLLGFINNDKYNYTSKRKYKYKSN